MNKTLKFDGMECGGISLHSMCFEWGVLSLCKRADVLSVLASSSLCEYWLADSEQAYLRSLSRPARQVSWLGGRISAKYSGSQFGWCEIPSNFDIATANNGRPTFKDGFVSISHAGEFMAGTVSHLPVGIDIETKSVASSLSVYAVLHEEEVTVLQMVLCVDRRHAIDWLWSCKEAAFKTFGEDQFAIFARDFEVLSLAHQNGQYWEASCVLRGERIKFKFWIGCFESSRVVVATPLS